MITVNWYSFIADNIAEKRGHFLAIITNIASMGTVYPKILFEFFVDFFRIGILVILRAFV